MLGIYYRMCAEVGLAPRPWNPVACEFTRHTTRRKVYRWLRDFDGSRRRLRVYPPVSPPYGVDSGSNKDPDLSTPQTSGADVASQRVAA